MFFFSHKGEVKLGNLLYNDFERIWLKNNILNILRNKEILHGHRGEYQSNKICGVAEQELIIALMIF